MPTPYPGAFHNLSNPSPGTPTTDAVIPHAELHSDINDLIEAIQNKLGLGVSGQAPSADTVLRAISGTGTQYGKIFNAQVDGAANIAKSKLNLTGQIGIADTDPSTFASLLSNNVIHNGDFSRAVYGGGPYTDSTTPGYLAERWFTQNSGAGVAQIQLFGGTTIPNPGAPRLYYQYRITTTSAGVPGTNQYQRLYQAIEGNTWDQIRDQPASVSFWVYSTIAGIFPCAIDMRGAGAAAQGSCVLEYSINTANTWEYKTLTFPAPSSGVPASGSSLAGFLSFQNSSGPNLRQAPGSWVNGSVQWGSTNQVNLSATNGAFWSIAGVRLVPGAQAAPFVPIDPMLADLICRRYRQIIFPGANSYGGVGVGLMASSTTADIDIPLVPRMRGTPTLTFSGTSGYWDLLYGTPTGFASQTVTGIAQSFHNTTNPDHLGLSVTIGTGITAGWPALLRSLGTNGLIEARAEL